MPIVATVLKSGGEFTVDHLDHFVREFSLFTQRWTRRNDFVPPRLVCLTDLDPETLPAGIEAIPMVDAWPEPWTMLELFKPGLFAEGEAVLYFRLDVDFLGDFINVFDAVDGLQTTYVTEIFGYIDSLDTLIDEASSLAAAYATSNVIAAAISGTATVAVIDVFDRTDAPTAAITEAKTILVTVTATDTPSAAISEASALLPTSCDIGAWERVP